MARKLNTVENRDDVVLVDRLYRLEDAAELLGYDSANYLRARIAAGDIAYVDLNPGGTRPVYRLRASQINQLVESLTFDPTPKLRSVA